MFVISQLLIPLYINVQNYIAQWKILEVLAIKFDFEV